MRLLLGLVLMLALAGAPGCGTGSYSRLVSEDEVPELVELKGRTRAFPNHTTLVPTGDDGVRIAVHEIGAGTRDRVLVFIHGVLSDHEAWRFVAGDLAQSYDLMLVDLPGCGDSDKPDPAKLRAGGYSPGAMAGRVLEALGARLEARERAGAPARSVTLVAHSLGGAVTLRMFCDEECAIEHRDVLSRVDGLVLMSPMDVNVVKPDPTFRRIAEVSSAEIALADASGVLKRRVADATLASMCNPERALREEADTRLAYMRDDARRRAAQAMLTQAVPWRSERPDWEAIEPLEGSYCRVELPALILWGRRDETLPVSMGYKLAAEIPGAELVCLPAVMHSPHIETPRECVRMIRDFVDRREAGSATLDSAHGSRAGIALHP